MTCEARWNLRCIENALGFRRVVFGRAHRRGVVLGRLLRECDFETHVAKSGLQALLILSERRVDAVVSDQFMPGLDGIGLLELVHDRYPECTRILCTGHPATDMVLDAVNRGRVHRVLAKTMHAVALRDEIERAVLVAHRTQDGRETKEPVSAGDA